jgi:dsRNA-specific ribonuclease
MDNIGWRSTPLRYLICTLVLECLLMSGQSIADVVESILGALYVSDGFDIKGAQAMYDTILRPFYDKHISLKTLSHHPTKILFELFQSRGCQEFEITKTVIGSEEKLVRCEGVHLQYPPIQRSKANSL